MVYVSRNEVEQYKEDEEKYGIQKYRREVQWVGEGTKTGEVGVEYWGTSNVLGCVENKVWK